MEIMFTQEELYHGLTTFEWYFRYNSGHLY